MLQAMQNNKELLSIIIVSYNTKNILKNCLESIIKETTVQYEILIVDNNSKDGTVEMLEDMKRKSSTIITIFNKENTGFGKANNQAVKLAKGKYVLLLNSDTIILDSAIDKLLGYYKSQEKNFGFLGPVLHNVDTSLQPSAMRFFTPIVIFSSLFLKGDYNGFSRWGVTKNEYVDWVSGACILTTRDTYDKVGGFDEEIFMYGEETDMLYRAKKLHINTATTNVAHIIHIGSASSDKTYPILQVYKGFLYFYQKHYSPISYVLLKSMLQLKAYIALVVGYVLHKKNLIHTYSQALTIVNTYERLSKR